VTETESTASSRGDRWSTSSDLRIFLELSLKARYFSILFCWTFLLAISITSLPTAVAIATVET
jgi:hypothetical protein